MIKMNFTFIVTVTILILSTSITLAEERSLVTPEAVIKNVDRPVRGLNMDQVKKQLGQPLKILEAVGNPPITRWIYKDFIVYFEHNLVLHSVLSR
ncbi:MAG: hypothetical protein GQ532_14485 [Methylomarinum sp.]|nr:hypothetical protein [Methylomarinum sp.]